MTTWKRFLVWSHAEVSSLINWEKQQQQKEQQQQNRPVQERGFNLDMSMCCEYVQRERRKNKAEIAVLTADISLTI